MSRISMVVAAVVLGTSCTYQGSPVPVAGDTRLLEGEWEGTYTSDQTGRTGSILFSLKAGTDSAYGDVLMIPARADLVGPLTVPPIPEQARRMTRVLRISFLRCDEGQVTGWLDPYDDPETGEQIHTTFEGRLKGNELRGTFSTFYPGSPQVLGGTWWVKRSTP